MDLSLIPFLEVDIIKSLQRINCFHRKSFWEWISFDFFSTKIWTKNKYWCNFVLVFSTQSCTLIITCSLTSSSLFCYFCWAAVVQKCEGPGTCWRFSLCSSVWWSRESLFILLQRSGCAADVRVSKGPVFTHTDIRIYWLIIKCYLAKCIVSSNPWCFHVLLQMTDMAVQYLTSGSLYLRELDVSGCSYLTDRSLRYLERICPPLTSIRMACCSGISR